MTTTDSRTPASPLAFGIASVLADAKRERGYTQTRLAELSGVSSYQISRFEAAKVDISVHDLLALCDALGVDVKDFVTRARFRAGEYELRTSRPESTTPSPA